MFINLTTSAAPRRLLRLPRALEKEFSVCRSPGFAGASRNASRRLPRQPLNLS